MRILALCKSDRRLCALSLDAPATAKEPAWCAVYRTGGNNCGFHTYEQCMATVSGIGGFCNRSPYAEPEKPAARREQAGGAKTQAQGTGTRGAGAKTRASSCRRATGAAAAARRDGPAAAGAATGRRAAGSACRGAADSVHRATAGRASERRARSFSPENMKPASRP